MRTQFNLTVTMTGEGGVSVSPSGTTSQLMNDNIELSATAEKGAYFIEWICDPIDAGTFENPTAFDTVFHAHTPIGPVTITAMFSYINPHQLSKHHRNPFLELQYMNIPLIRATRDSYSLGTKAYYAAKIIQAIVKENNTFSTTDTGVDFGKLKDRSIVDTSIDLSNGVAASIIAVATGSKTFDLTAPLNLTDFSSFDQREYY